MAQHIPVENLQSKKLNDMAYVIRRDFARSYGMKTSMKYQFVGEQEDNEVYQIHKTIPSGFVVGNKATFEIHFNREEDKIKEIYLVA